MNKEMLNPNNTNNPVYICIYIYLCVFVNSAFYKCELNLIPKNKKKQEQRGNKKKKLGRNK